ncbi:MAG TPA: hypothetical protein VK541_02775 [Pedobacter sp.]|uniref:hypothetical protein n=1 Tax=Pedobacter sp. TaxID=1411316 RepID=UPI002C3CEB40|nr:hypothetical protein [Pedobacter sp.]HMI01375.1 hypothetical protein [Pedobacter sp.]
MMNQADIFKKIGVILSELQEQYEFLAQNPEQLNELELELFLANANFLSDHVEIIRKLNTSRIPKELPQHTEISSAQAEQIPARPIAQEQAPVVDDLPEPKDYTFFEKPADLVDYVNEEPENTAHTFEFILNDNPESGRFDFGEQPADEIFREPELKEDIVEEKVVPAPITSLVEDKIEKQVVQPGLFRAEPEKPAENEAPTAARPTLNDLLAGNKSSGSPKVKDEDSKPPVTDLKGAITLNEKLLYIKDLFNGYNLAYSEAIDLINKMPDLKTADHFLKNNYAEKNNWQAKQGTVDQFYELLARRFPNG